MWSISNILSAWTLSPQRAFNRWPVILIVVLASACDRQTQTPRPPTRQEQRNQALDYLDKNIAVIAERVGHPHYQEQREDLAWRLDTFKRARAWLESQPAESPIAPYPIIAGLSKTPEGHYGLSLSWLESGFDAHGVTLIDDAGILGTVDHCFPDDGEAMRELRKSSLLRLTTLFFTVADRNAGGSDGRPDFRLDRPLRVPPLRVRLRSGSGVESVEIEAAINWATVGHRDGRVGE